MDVKKASIIAIIILIISAGLMTYAYLNRPVETVYTVHIDNVTFKTHFNVSDLVLNSSEYGANHYVADKNRVNIWVFNFDATMSQKLDYSLENECSNPRDINGHVVYLTSSNVGDHVGETRYLSVIEDKDKERFILASSQDMNETSYIIDNIVVG